LLSLPERFARFEEGLQVVNQLLKSGTPVDFKGKYYHLQQAIVLPRPLRPGGPPILVGGNGARRTLPLVAHYASEWNAVYVGADEFVRLNARLDDLLRAAGRQPAEVRRSLMAGCVYGRTPEEVAQKVAARTQGKSSPAELRQRSLVVGTGSEIRDQLAQLDAAGVQCIMLQWLDLDDLSRIQALAKEVIY
jgi:alkanesulfonate monooxygenase SsuD/methylene tetrahydromethanopterin reductase-like flavin-dependent oxidoreductase (luciferase family)